MFDFDQSLELKEGAPISLGRKAETGFDKEADVFQDIDAEQFDEKLKEYLQSQSKHFTYIKFPKPIEWDDGIALSTSYHVFSALSRVRKYRYKEYEERVPASRQTLGAIGIKFTIGEIVFWERERGKHYYLTAELLVNGKMEQTHCANLSVSKTYLFRDDMIYQSPELYSHELKTVDSPVSVNMLKNMQKVIEAYIYAIEHVPSECLRSMQQVYKQFRGVSIYGDICCGYDAERLMNHINKYGFEKNLEKKIGTNLIKNE